MNDSLPIQNLPPPPPTQHIHQNTPQTPLLATRFIMSKETKGRKGKHLEFYCWATLVLRAQPRTSSHGSAP